MIREDYRRALIMLRSLRPGVSGHVRLERRTLFATLQFTVSGTDGTPLQGFLLGRVNGKWQGAALGAFGAPRYGQAGLTVKFDPRNIQGLTLEQYALIGVAAQTAQGYIPLLFVNLNGSIECTLECVQAECARLFGTTAQDELLEADVPIEADEPPAANSLPEPESTENSAMSDEQAVQPEEEQTADELDSPAPEAPEAASSDDSPPETDELDAPAASDETDEAFDAPARSGEAQAQSSGDSPAETDELDAPAQKSDVRSRLALSECAWPEALQELRAFFEAEAPVDEGFTYGDYTFARADLACVAGAEYCLVGVRAQNGRVDSVCYAVPAASGEVEPPAGLESYRREGDYWVYCQDISWDDEE